MKKRIELL
jgi:adenosine deaminase CECR1